LIRVLRFITTVILVMPLFSCGGTRPANLGIKDSRLAPCPSTPNCISSDDLDLKHRVVPLELTLAIPAGEAWRGVRAAVAGLPRTKIITDGDDYLHAECSSAFFGFVDDLELHLRAGNHLIAVRSAARLGHGDFGVNRRRVEALRLSLRRQGIVR
jgi:uncharacterized protein (DUF1499 family)